MQSKNGQKKESICIPGERHINSVSIRNKCIFSTTNDLLTTLYFQHSSYPVIKWRSSFLFCRIKKIMSKFRLEEQVKKLVQTLKHPNNRPIQPLNARPVLQ